MEVSPADAAVALRSFPRRYRAVLVRPDNDDADAVVTRPSQTDGWSALDHAAHAATSLTTAAEALRLVSISDEPLVALAPERREPAATIEEVLGRIAAAAEEAAGAVDRIKGKDWGRVGRTGPEEAPITALELARHAVDEGVRHLRAAERAVDEAVSSR